MVAKVRSGTSWFEGDRTSSDFVLHVERVLKGPIAPGMDISATVEGCGDFIHPQRNSRPARDVYGIWLLKSGDRGYRVVPRWSDRGELDDAAVWLPAEAPAGESGGTPAISAANELLAALRWLASTRADDIRKVVRIERPPEQGGTQIIRTQSYSRAETLVGDLMSLPPEVAISASRQLAGDRSAYLRSKGIAGLILMNDPEGPKRAAAALKPLSQSGDAGPVLGSFASYHNAADPEAVRAIAQIAVSGTPQANGGPSYALRVLHTKEAMPALVALLDAAQPGPRANALAGICLFVRNAVTVTPDAVRSMAWMAAREPAPFRTADTDRFCWMGGTPQNAAGLTDYIAFWKETSTALR